MSRRFWLILGAGAVVVLADAVVLAVIGFPVTEYVQERAARLAKERFASDLSLSGVRISLLPVTVRIDNVVLHHKGRRDVPPLIQIRRATVRMSLRSLFSLRTSRPSVRQVRLEGLVIHVARRPAPGEPGKKETPALEKKGGATPAYFVVDELIADGTMLRVLPKDAWKEPLEFDLRSLHMKSAGLGEPMQFVSVLTNAKPTGLIHTSGKFGPWEAEDPGMTPVRGEYSFDKADMGDLNGLGGTLSSKGRYEGPLARLAVQGYTDTPNFSVDVSGQPIHLKTTFKAIVDGTDGDTLLQPVVATFGRSRLVANGGVYGIKGVKGKTVRLHVVVNDGRIEDMLRFAVKSKEPMLTGPISYEADMEVPPGKERVVTKLKLEGDFSVSKGRFGSAEVRRKLGEMSNKATGKPEAAPPSDTASDFSGHFRLGGGMLSLKKLSFQIPGAHVNVDGTYHLVAETLDFKGTLEMDAPVSRTTTGVKSWLLRLADPFFRRKNKPGARVPITIKGTASDPKPGLDIGEVLTP
jgi:hypothetical protein